LFAIWFNKNSANCWTAHICIWFMKFVIDFTALLLCMFLMEIIISSKCFGGDLCWAHFLTRCALISSYCIIINGVVNTSFCTKNSKIEHSRYWSLIQSVRFNSTLHQSQFFVSITNTFSPLYYIYSLVLLSYLHEILFIDIF